MRRVWQLAALLLVVTLAWQGLRGFFPEQERRLRSGLRELVAEQYPDAARQVAASFGIRRHPESPAGAARDVVLIHGLDDPGRVWMNLGPALAAAGYRTWVMTYPNDQPITASAHFFDRELTRLKQQGVERLTVVAHSMGGLVTRELLTHPQLACRDSRGCSRPRVEQLIMIGTPNRGSELARLRGLGEVREQLSKVFDDDFHWLRFIIDGAGEAGLDLTPGSAFLAQLNARPRPDGTGYLVIAGVIGPDEQQRLGTVRKSLVEALPQATAWVDELLAHIEALHVGIGDGLVPLSSAHLDGEPLCVVTGNHLSIVRNIFESSQRVPPAVPLVLEALTGAVSGSLSGDCLADRHSAHRTNK